MLDCDDEQYQRWWPGVHFEFHTVTRKPDDFGNVVFMDESVGKYRLRFKAVVTELVANERITWRAKKGIRLPGWLTLELANDSSGVQITHTLFVGYTGVGRFLDMFLKLYFSDRFEKELAAHANEEFRKLGTMLCEARAET